MLYMGSFDEISPFVLNLGFCVRRNLKKTNRKILGDANLPTFIIPPSKWVKKNIDCIYMNVLMPHD